MNATEPAGSGRRRSALVVGASSGIGAASARVLAARGFSVDVFARRLEPLTALADEIGASAVALDVTAPDAVEEQMRAAADRHDGVDVAVYVAGRLEVAPVKRHPVELWNEILAVNLTGAFLTARALFERMLPGGRMIFVSSISGRAGQSLMSAYSASKGGLERFAQALSGELERRGVGVHVVAPGQVATPMLDRPATSPFQLEPERVAEVVGWLAELPGDMRLPDVEVHPVEAGPYAHAREVR